MEDLKNRYKDDMRGIDLIKAYVKSLELSRKINSVDVLLKENKTIEFVIGGSDSPNVLNEVKHDIQGELCSVSKVCSCYMNKSLALLCVQDDLSPYKMF